MALDRGSWDTAPHLFAELQAIAGYQDPLRRLRRQPQREEDDNQQQDPANPNRGEKGGGGGGAGDGCKRSRPTAADAPVVAALRKQFAAGLASASPVSLL